MEKKEIIEYLKQNLSEKRLKHSIGVSTAAKELAARYGCDPNKAELAGLVHDCARDTSKEALLYYIEQEGIILDEKATAVKELLHGPAAVYICRKEFNINDEDILSAVRYHTTGKVNMTLLQKIIFLADYIEPTRDFPGVEELRALACKDLDKALLSAFDSTLRYIIAREGFIHPDTITARNHLILTSKDSIGK